MISVVSDLGWQVKSNRQPCLPLLEQVAVAFVGFFCRRVTSILAHGPETAAVHIGLDTTGERKFTRKAQLFFIILRLGDLDIWNWNGRWSGEFFFSFCVFRDRRFQNSFFPPLEFALNAHKHLIWMKVLDCETYQVYTRCKFKGDKCTNKQTILPKRKRHIVENGRADG